MLLNKDLEFGVIRGLIVTFENKGDVLRWHTHDVHSAHISIIGRGAFRVEVSSDPPDAAEMGIMLDRTVAAGAIVDTAHGLWHQFTALEDGSRLFQIIKEPI